MKNLKNEKQKLSFLRLRGASGAQGISAPALCREAHKRRFTFNSLILRFASTPLRMTIPALAFLLSLNISESRADTCICSLDGANNTLTITNCPNGVLSSSACSDQKTANNVVVGTGVTSIEAGAFYEASSLTSITIPDSVTSIGMVAFCGADRLTSIIIPDSVTSIGYGAFVGASRLTSITIPDSVTSIGNQAFDYATGLTEIIIPDSLTAEQITKLKDASLKSGLTVYCQGATGTCKAALDAAGYSYAEVKQADSTRCSGKYIYDTTCRQRNENECNSVAKYYYNSSANNGAGQCQLLPKTQSACTGNGLAWDPTSSKCTNTNYTSSQEVNNGGTEGDQEEVVSGSVDEAACREQGKVFWGEECYDTYPFTKKRWTPAEANEWLHDGNDNFVIITFKK